MEEKEREPRVKIGTCSWNYYSWIGLVYSQESPTSAGYLREYSKRFRTVEVDSWFYKLPDSRDVLDYAANVDEKFSFTIKLSEELSLTHKRAYGSKALVPNPSFLSLDLFSTYLARVGPMLPRIDALMLEFEYLNKDKMKSAHDFMKALERFAASVPKGVPVAVETRNANYLTKEYFQFLKEKNLIHVFSEKIYMPHIYDVYEDNGDSLTETTVLRLLGGDRAAMEEKTHERWNQIVDEKPDKDRIVRMIQDITLDGGTVILNINNHYEGSAPLSAAFFEKALR